jgi:hypothetical protein
MDDAADWQRAAGGVVAALVLRPCVPDARTLRARHRVARSRHRAGVVDAAGYSLIGAARVLDPGAFHHLVSAPDYGILAISGAWLGAIAAIGWRTPRQSIGRAPIVLGCVATRCLAWFVRGRGLDLLDSEHVFAFAIGVGVAIGRVLGDPIRLPRLIATWPRIGPVTRASRSRGAGFESAAAMRRVATY